MNASISESVSLFLKKIIDPRLVIAECSCLMLELTAEEGILFALGSFTER